MLQTILFMHNLHVDKCRVAMAEKAVKFDLTLAEADNSRCWMASFGGDKLRSLVPADMDLPELEESEQGEPVDYEEDNESPKATQNTEGERCAAQQGPKLSLWNQDRMYLASATRLSDLSPHDIARKADTLFSTWGLLCHITNIPLLARVSPPLDSSCIKEDGGGVLAHHLLPHSGKYWHS